MNILIGFLIAVEVIVSLLLILIVLVQPSKSGGGLGGAAFGGGGMGEQLFGARAGNVLTKGTVLFAVIFVVNTLALALLYSRTTGTSSAPVTGRTAPPAPGALMGLPEVPADAAEAADSPDTVEEVEPVADEAEEPADGDVPVEMTEEEELPVE